MEEGYLTVQRPARNLHSVVEKGVEGDLWGRLRVCLWPCDIQDECFGVLEVTYLLFNIKIK